MQKLIVKYALAAHLAFLAVAPLFLSGTAVIWLSILAFVWVFMQPSMRAGEALHDARHRVTKATFRDPVFWTAVAFSLMAAIRCANGGVRVCYDAEKLVWTLSSPTMPYLPGSVAQVGYSEFAASVALVALLLGCRQALGKWARFAFFLLTSLFSGCVAITLMALTILYPGSYDAFLSCPLSNPTFVGAFFGVNLMLALVAFLAVFERGWLRMVPLAFVGVASNAAGVFCFAPPWVAFLTLCAISPLLLYVPVYARKVLGHAGDFRFVAAFVLSFAMAACVVWGALPHAVLNARLEPWTTGAFLSDGFKGLREALSAVSFKAWLGRPWIGSGLGSFPFVLNFHATEADWLLIEPGQLAPLNGYWHLLVEQGIVGAVFVLVLLGELLWGYGRMFCQCILNGWPHPACFSGVLTLAALLVETAVDSSLWLPATFGLTLVCLVLSTKSFSKEKLDV